MARIKKSVIEAAVENAEEIKVVPFPDDAMNPPEVEEVEPVKEEVEKVFKPAVVLPVEEVKVVVEEVKPVIENEYIMI